RAGDARGALRPARGAVCGRGGGGADERRGRPAALDGRRADRSGHRGGPLPRRVLHQAGPDPARARRLGFAAISFLAALGVRISILAATIGLLGLVSANVIPKVPALVSRSSKRAGASRAAKANWPNSRNSSCAGFFEYTSSVS